jgi:hypothetical protein
MTASLLPPNVDSAGLPSLAHGVRADGVHWTEVWNFSLAGTRSSIEMGAALESQPSLRDAPIEVLHHRPRDWPRTFMSPFAVLVWQGSMSRAGMRIGMGVAPYETRWYSEQQVAQIVAAADREVLLEERRRRVSPHASSRLTCIWAAEDTTSGRNFIQRLMGPHAFVLSVEVLAAIRVSKCDARWLDEAALGSVEAADQYWNGSPMGDHALWEYLIDGTIGAREPEDVERMTYWARSNIPPDLLGPSAGQS